jgi:2-polyprenyl-3-methyl-5-hydroxy-6-metoxy-1,4-benzoquinol methylase
MLPIDDYSVEYYKRVNKEEGAQAEAMADFIVSVFNPKTVIDLGCGTGLYISSLMARGVDCLGIDSSENAFDYVFLRVDSTKVMAGDLRERLTFPQADLVLCLEVLEHIQEEFADQAVDNIVNAGKVLIVSPSPHGGGEHHHNPQPKRYWIEKFRKRGYIEIPEKSKEIQEFLSKFPHATWIDNIYILRKTNA